MKLEVILVLLGMGFIHKKAIFLQSRRRDAKLIVTLQIILHRKLELHMMGGEGERSL
jgi:hypothetical protein